MNSIAYPCIYYLVDYLMYSVMQFILSVISAFNRITQSINESNHLISNPGKKRVGQDIHVIYIRLLYFRKILVIHNVIQKYINSNSRVSLSCQSETITINVIIVGFYTK